MSIVACPPLARASGGGFQLAGLSLEGVATGLDDGQVLTARTIDKGSPGNYETVVYRIDGEQVTEELTVSGTHGFEMYALRPDRA
jgi:hypothetical protein